MEIAFDEGSLSFEILKDNQHEWVKTRGDHDYWIWLWGYPEKAPDQWRSPADRALEHVWLIPYRVWAAGQTRAWDVARIKTIPIDGDRARIRRELAAEKVFVTTLFADYRLKMDHSVWWPSEKIEEYLGWQR